MSINRDDLWNFEVFVARSNIIDRIDLRRKIERTISIRFSSKLCSKLLKLQWVELVDYICNYCFRQNLRELHNDVSNIHIDLLLEKIELLTIPNHVYANLRMQEYIVCTDDKLFFFWDWKYILSQSIFLSKTKNYTN